MAIENTRATLAVKRRLACEMVKYWQQVQTTYSRWFCFYSLLTEYHVSIFFLQVLTKHLSLQRHISTSTNALFLDAAMLWLHFSPGHFFHKSLHIFRHAIVFSFKIKAQVLGLLIIKLNNLKRMLARVVSAMKGFYYSYCSILGWNFILFNCDALLRRLKITWWTFPWRTAGGKSTSAS